MNAPRARRRRRFAALAAALGLVAGLALAELGVRVYLTFALLRAVDTRPAPAPSDPAAPLELGQLVYHVENRRLGFRLKPHARGLFHGAPIELNSMGLRCPELPATKPPGAIRVVGLGDSTMFGWGIPLGLRYVDHLERGLRAAFGPERPVEVVPAAIPSWNAVQEVEFLETEWPRLQPDAVFIQFDQNDVEVTFPRLRPRFLAAPKVYLLRLRALWRGTLLAEEVNDPRVAPMEEAQRRLIGFDPLKEAYARLATLCRERGIPLLASLTIRHDLHFPPEARFQDRDRYNRFAEICRDLGIDLIDPSDPARMAPWPDAPWPGEACLYLVNDGHAGPIGHAAIAGAIFSDLLARLAPGRLDAAQTQKALADFQNRLAPAIAAPPERGLYWEEDWGGGVKVRWGQRRVSLPIEPTGKTLALNYVISHPDISAANPVVVEVELDGRPAGRFEHEKGGYYARKIPLTGGERRLELRVNRSFRENGNSRALAIALYPVQFE